MKYFVLKIYFRLKTGNVPPEDFIFEELQPGMEVKASTLRKTSRSISTASVDLNPNTNNYQRKRELEKKIGIHEIELAKGKTVHEHIFWGGLLLIVIMTGIAKLKNIN